MKLRSDPELIASALEGDLGAYDELMQRYERLVFQVAQQWVQNSEAAMDVVQTVFLKAFQSLAQFRQEASVKTWIMRITYNESIEWLRRSREHHSLEEVAEELAQEAHQEGELLRRDDRALIRKALEVLNERYRLAVVLRYFQGFGIQEIAQVLGCSEGVTKNMLFRSLRSMRESLTGGGA